MKYWPILKDFSGWTPESWDLEAAGDFEKFLGLIPTQLSK